MTQTNNEIRRAAGAAGVKLWMIADKLGYTDAYFSRLLRKEFSAERKQQIISIIQELEQGAG